MRIPCFALSTILALATGLDAGTQPVVAKRPGSRSPSAKSRAVLFAERDVARLKLLAKKDAKLAARLKNAEARLAVLRSDRSGGQVDPKRIRAVGSFKLSRPAISCRYDAEGRFLFAGAMDSAVHRFDTLSGRRTDLAGHESWIRRIDLHLTDGTMFTGSYAGRLIWWKPGEPSPKPLRTIEAHKGYVRGVAVSPDGKLVATGGNDNMVRVWSAKTGKLLKELAGHKRHVYNLRFDPSGKFIVSGDLMGVLKQWEVGTWKHVRDLDAKVLTKYDKTFRADCGGIRGMDFSPRGKYLVVCGISAVTNAFAGVGKPTAVLFDFKTGKRLQVMLPRKNYRGTCWGVKWHPSGKWFVGAGGSGGGMLWFWKPESAKSFFAYKLPGCGYDVSFHPDGLRLAVALYNRTITVYDLGPKASQARARK